MQRMINNTETVIDEMLEGYVNSYPDEYRKLDQGNILMRRNTEDRVSVIIGAGGGNEPWPIGYVGKGPGRCVCIRQCICGSCGQGYFKHNPECA